MATLPEYAAEDPEGAPPSFEDVLEKSGGDPLSPAAVPATETTSAPELPPPYDSATVEPEENNPRMMTMRLRHVRPKVEQLYYAVDGGMGIDSVVHEYCRLCNLVYRNMMMPAQTPIVLHVQGGADFDDEHADDDDDDSAVGQYELLSEKIDRLSKMVDQADKQMRAFMQKQADINRAQASDNVRCDADRRELRDKLERLFSLQLVSDKK